MSEQNSNGPSRRDFLGDGIRAAALLGLGGVVGVMLSKGRVGKTLWQIDPQKCTQCGKCATTCVLTPSAAKCYHSHYVCGYCKFCTGYFDPEPNALNTGAENQLCPTGAIKRRHIEGTSYEYTIDLPTCIGCAKCVKGCGSFGNASLFMQIDQKLCVNCNWCSIAANCPAQAISRVPGDKPYILKTKTRTS